MNKEENQTYAKPGDKKKAMILVTIKKYAKIFISAQNYLHFVNNRRSLAIYLQRKLSFNLSF